MSHPYGNACAAFNQSCPQVWQDYTTHQFVQQIAAGNLPKNAFYHYLVQDYLYLVEYAKAWALGVVKADTPEEMSYCSQAVDGLVNMELKLHLQLCAQEGIDKAHILNSQADLEMLAYTRYLLAEGHNAGFLDLLAIVAPCAFGYGEIGLKLGQQKPVANNPYQMWIDTYAGAEYQDFCHTFGAFFEQALVARLGKNYMQTPMWQTLCKKYRIASQLEIAFWQMGVRGQYYWT